MSSSPACSSEVAGVDLRGFIEVVRETRPSDLVDIHREVSPRFETAAITAKLEQSLRTPVFFYRRLTGSPFPMLSNVCGSWGRVALALNCRIPDVAATYAQRVQRPIRPVICGEAPVQQEVVLDEKVDLSSLPQLVYHEGDSESAYITAAIVVARDPETRRFNLSFHRLMIVAKNRTGIYIARGKHLDRIYDKYKAARQAMPIAAFVGWHPLWAIGALYTGDPDVDEYEIIGGLQESPLKLAKCKTTPDLAIPANAEFVFEGTVDPEARTEEGPFGEFTGYATGSGSTPVFNIKAITHRHSPVFQDVVSGHSEHSILPLLGMEYNLFKAAKAAVPSTLRVKLGLPLTAFVSIAKTHDCEPAAVAEALLDSDIYVKQVVVVDADVDVADLKKVATAIALHMSPAQDLTIYHSKPGTELDPSCRSCDGTVSKLAIDATVPLASRGTIRKNRIPEAVLNSIDLRQLLQ